MGLLMVSPLPFLVGFLSLVGVDGRGGAIALGVGIGGGGGFGWS